MCRSVPQIAVFSSLTSTSFGPISGTGTCSIQIPCAASRLTRAFIICVMDGLALPVGEPVDYTWPAPARGSGRQRMASDWTRAQGGTHAQGGTQPRGGESHQRHVHQRATPRMSMVGLAPAALCPTLQLP